MFLCELSISELTLNSALGFKYTSNIVILGHNIQLEENKKRWKCSKWNKIFLDWREICKWPQNKCKFVQRSVHSVWNSCTETILFLTSLDIKLGMYYRHRKSQIWRHLSKSFLDTLNVCSLELPVAAHISLMHRSSLGNQISVTCFCNLFGCALRGFLSPCRVSNLHFLD